MDLSQKQFKKNQINRYIVIYNIFSIPNTEYLYKKGFDFLGYSFFFWANENAEPPHIHECKGHPTENATKFWVTKGGIQLEHNKSQIPTKELKKILRYIMENRSDILAAWFDYFSEL